VERWCFTACTCTCSYVPWLVQNNVQIIRFDNENTCAERTQIDKTAPIRDIWIMLNKMEKAYKSYECITIVEQLFPFRGHTKFTQFIPSKTTKYGIKILWVCDASNTYPVQGQIYTGKPIDGPRQVNVDKWTVLNLVSLNKNSGRNITTDNFFTTMELAKVLNSWNMTLVGTVRKKQKIFSKQHATYQRKACLFNQFCLPSWCNSLFICAFVIYAHVRRSWRNTISQARDNKILQQKAVLILCAGTFLQYDWRHWHGMLCHL